MTATPSITCRPAPKIVFVVALLFAVFAAALIDIVIPINILDIAQTFNISSGTVGQLDSFIAFASVATALLLGAFGVRFRYKSLVMVGIMCIAFCAVGFFLAPTFPIAQLVVPLNGIGSVLIVVTAQTFIGNSYPLSKKAKAIGWVAAAGIFANAVGAPITGFMTSIGGWRSVFLWFMLPTALASLIFVFLAFPYDPPEAQVEVKKEPFMRGLKQVLTNKSAAACLMTAFFGNAFVFGAMAFEVTFLRQVYLTSLSYAAMVGPLAGTAVITAGAIIGGHVVNRVGRKRLTVTAIFLAGMFVLFSYFVEGLLIFLAFRWIASIFIGVTVAASSNLMLEQVPQFRGTAMSLNSAFSGVGTAIGIIIVGAVLNLYVNPTTGFQALGLTVGAFAFAAVFVNFFFAKDPIKT